MATIASLKTPEEVSEAVNGIVTASRLLELAEAGIAPHYRVDDNVFFALGEIKEWLNHNFMVRCPGQHIGDNFATIVNVVAVSKPQDVPPVELRAIASFLVPMPLASVETAPLSGVYFLVSDGKVVYVGQAGNVFNRVGAHMGNKTFDGVWFMRVPKSDLNFVESAFINALRPKYNHSSKGRLISPRCDTEPSEQSVMQVSAIQEE